MAVKFFGLFMFAYKKYLFLIFTLHIFIFFPLLFWNNASGAMEKPGDHHMIAQQKNFLQTVHTPQTNAIKLPIKDSLSDFSYIEMQNNLKITSEQNPQSQPTSFWGSLYQENNLCLIIGMFFVSLLIFWNFSLQRKSHSKTKALLEYTERYKAIFNATNDAILLLDINDKSIVEVNLVTLELSGYSENELIGQDMSILCNQNDDYTIDQILSEIYEKPDGIPQNFHFQIRSKENKQYYMDVSFSFVSHEGASYILVIMRNITTFKKVVNDLEESENKFRILAETVPLGILLYQEDKWIYANPAAERISGYSREELMNMQFWEFVHPDYIDMVKEMGKKRQIGEQLQSDYEFLIVSKQGTEKWIHLSGNTTEFQGKAAGIIACFDITARKNAERQLLFSRNFMEAILSALPMPFFSKDIHGRYQFVNQAFAEFTGMTPEEVQGRTPKECWPQEVAEYFTKNDYDLLSKTDSSFSDYEYLIPHNKKGERYCYINKACFRNADGELAGLVGAFLDVTELKNTEKALMKNEEKYRTVFENTGTATVIVDESTRIVMANKEIEEITGYSSEDLVGYSFTEFVYPEDLDIVLDYHYNRGKSSNNHRNTPPTKYTIRVYDKFRNIKTVVNSVVQLPESDQRVVSFLDITEQTRLEKQLRESQKMEAVGRLAGGVAHEFNNLLQGLSGNIELLLSDKESEDSDRRYVKELERITSRAKDVVKQLLTLGRKVSVSFQLQDLNSIINNLAGFLKRTIPKNIELNTDLPPNLPFINADRTQLEQVLINLVNNASDAIPLETNGTIEIITREEKFEPAEVDSNPVPEKFVTLSVTDSGRGMDKEIREQIFEPFFTTKDVNQGTGLGLSTVYGIVRSHNATIKCYSEIGRGTSFTIYFPVDGDQDRELTKEDSKESNISWDDLRGNETVLVVDDEEMLVDLVTDILENSGYTVCSELDGASAIETYKHDHDKIDLVMVDIGMPGMSGDACIQKLREFDPGVKVIIVTGYASSDVEQNPEKYGADAFLKKPYQRAELLEKIRMLFEDKHK